MKKLIYTLTLLVSYVAQAAPVRIAIDFKDSASISDVTDSEKETGLDIRPNSVLFSATKLTYAFVDSTNLDSVLNELNNDSDVQAAEVSNVYTALGSGADFDTPDDPYLPKQAWHFDMIGLPQAWKYSTGKGAVVAVLDTGISGPNSKYPMVPDLEQTCFVPGYDFAGDTNDPYDAQSHGTHVGSTIAESTNNNLGGVGIAFNACLMPVKVLSDQGSGSTEDIAEGIQFAADNGAHIINMSLGGGGFSQIMYDALQYAVEKNVIVVCAAGNASSDIISYPAAMDGCLAISAVGPDRKLASYSSYGKSPDGKKGLFLAAPGGDTQKFGPAGGVWQSTIERGNPNKWGMFPYNGTSMATPMVAGAAALVVSAMGPDNYDREDVIAALQKSSSSEGDETEYGAGILNVGQTLKDLEGGMSIWSVALVLGLVLTIFLSRKWKS